MKGRTSTRAAHRTRPGRRVTAGFSHEDFTRAPSGHWFGPQVLQWALAAFYAIACDDGVGDEVRLSAAEQLAALDPHAAAKPS